MDLGVVENNKQPIKQATKTYLEEGVKAERTANRWKDLEMLAQTRRRWRDIASGRRSNLEQQA